MVTFDDVLGATRRLNRVAIRTPLAHARIGSSDVVCKCENRQVTGSFKFRGAFNMSAQVPEEQRSAGLVAISSGNHAQAVAFSARLLRTSALIAMPEDSSDLKMRRTRELGAEIVLFDRFAKDRDEVLAELLKEHGRIFVPPYDHPHVIAGQGTTALELLDDEPDIDVLVVPVSGGGLISGCSIVAKERGVRVIGVEPETANDMQLSMRAGERLWIEAPVTIADGLRTQIPGEVTFPIVQANVDDIVTVSDDQIREAMKRVRKQTGEIIEPSGAVGIAAIAAGHITGGRIGVILSGGNVENV